MDATDFGYITPYLVGFLAMVATGALTRYGWWIIAMVITVCAGGLSAYVFAQITEQTAAPVLFMIAILGSVLFFVAAGGAVGIVAGFLLRWFRRQEGTARMGQVAGPDHSANAAGWQAGQGGPAPKP